MSRRSTASSRGYVGDVSAGSVYASGSSSGTVRTVEGVRVPRPSGDPTGEGYAKQYAAYVAVASPEQMVGVSPPTSPTGMVEAGLSITVMPAATPPTGGTIYGKKGGSIYTTREYVTPGLYSISGLPVSREEYYARKATARAEAYRSGGYQLTTPYTEISYLKKKRTAEEIAEEQRLMAGTIVITGSPFMQKAKLQYYRAVEWGKQPIASFVTTEKFKKGKELLLEAVTQKKLIGIGPTKYGFITIPPGIREWQKGRTEAYIPTTKGRVATLGAYAAVSFFLAPIGSAVSFIPKPVQIVGGVSLAGLYVYGKGKEYSLATTPREKGKVIGRTEAELGVAIAGGYAGSKFWPWARGKYLITKAKITKTYEGMVEGIEITGGTRITLASRKPTFEELKTSFVTGKLTPRAKDGAVARIYPHYTGLPSEVLEVPETPSITRGLVVMGEKIRLTTQRTWRTTPVQHIPFKFGESIYLYKQTVGQLVKPESVKYIYSWHATSGFFPAYTVTLPSKRGLAGLFYTATRLQEFGLGIGGEYKPLGFGLPKIVKPTGLRILTVSETELPFKKIPSGIKPEKFLITGAEKGVWYAPLLKPEYEAGPPLGTPLVRYGKTYFTKIKGVTIPLYQTVTGPSKEVALSLARSLGGVKGPVKWLPYEEGVEGYPLAYSLGVGIVRPSGYKPSEYKAASYYSSVKYYPVGMPSYKVPGYQKITYKTPGYKVPSYPSGGYPSGYVPTDYIPPTYKPPTYKPPTYKTPPYEVPPYKPPYTPPIIPIKWRVDVFGFKGKGGMFRKPKFKPKYTPSVEAGFFGIRGRQPRTITGLETRPLPLLKKLKRRK